MVDKNWPQWLPKGTAEFKPLTQAQVNYIKVLFRLPSDTVDDVYLCEGGISGNPNDIKNFMKRFKYFD